MLNTTEERTITVALAGAPNVGKSTVFNMLTGLSQHVGNWPGKTVEHKTGVFRRGNLTMNVTDLPGTYSLTANSAEEQIARDYLVNESPDVVVAVLNAASLERNLYLVAELIELAPCLIIALNMLDVAEQHGMKIHTEAMAAALNIPVIPLVARANRGMHELVNQIEHECSQTEGRRDVKHIEYGKEIKQTIDHVERLLDDSITEPYPRHWTAMKLLEGDEQIHKLIRGRMSKERWSTLEAYLRDNETAAVTIATLRFEWIETMMSVVYEKPRAGQVTLTERIDRAATHPFWGLLILIAVLGALFWLVFSVGVPIQEFLNVTLVDGAHKFIYSDMTFLPAWVQGFLADGVISGAGMVVTFVPILFFFFAAWAAMEDTGYTARAAFVTDRFMHALGLHGKSCLPLVLGFGCNVPAVLGTRIIDSPRARLLTILVAPLVPCTGRMAVVAIIAAAFFGTAAVLISIGLILFSLLVLLIIGVILNRFVIRGESSALIMELPLYHVPDLKLIGLVTWQNILAFLKRAGTVILAVSIIVWLLSVIPTGDINSSVLAGIGKLFEPLGSLMGLNWQMMVALLSSFVAKENTIATLGVMLSGNGADLTQQLQTMLTPAAAMAFLVIQVLFIPCVATISVIRQETGGWRWPIFSIILQLVISFGLAILVFQAASLFH
ncbi:MAG: ferrous iron transport protein B [Dehalococcoidia bacterium]|nr:ferrous iron transport protein B [Dehalococcoidia bacterium]